MRYKLLGKSGLRVSEICLGAMGFGEELGWGSDKEHSRDAFQAFVEAGGNFIDTANVYTRGTSEKYLGEFVAGARDRFVLATKYTLGGGDKIDPNASGNQRKNMRQSLEASLKRLNTDYIDLYWLHIWDFLTPEEEKWLPLVQVAEVGNKNEPQEKNNKDSWQQKFSINFSAFYNSCTVKICKTPKDDATHQNQIKGMLDPLSWKTEHTV